MRSVIAASRCQSVRHKGGELSEAPGYGRDQRSPLPHRIVSLGTRLLITVRALTCWTLGAEVAVVDHGGSGGIARSSHEPWPPPASSYCRAALDAAGTAWTMTGRGSRNASSSCPGPHTSAFHSSATTPIFIGMPIVSPPRSQYSMRRPTRLSLTLARRSSRRRGKPSSPLSVGSSADTPDVPHCCVRAGQHARGPRAGRSVVRPVFGSARWLPSRSGTRIMGGLGQRPGDVPRCRRRRSRSLYCLEQL